MTFYVSNKPQQLCDFGYCYRGLDRLFDRVRNKMEWWAICVSR